MKNKTKQRTKEVKVRLTEGELARLNDNVALTGLSREQRHCRPPITGCCCGRCSGWKPS